MKIPQARIETSVGWEVLEPREHVCMDSKCIIARLWMF